MRKNDWVSAIKGQGYRVDSPKRKRHFPKNSVGIFEEIQDDTDSAIVFLVGLNERWITSINTGLGRFKNGENYLYNAIRYLEERDDAGQ